MTTTHGNHNAHDAAIDAAIAGGSALVGLLAATTFAVVRADPPAFIYAGVVAFLVAFLASLQAARGRRAPAPPAPPP